MLFSASEGYILHYGNVIRRGKYWIEKMAESEKDITNITAGLARRMNIHTVSRLISVSMLWGAGVAMMLVVIGKFTAVPLVFGVTVILCASLIVGIIRGILARVSALEGAMTTDAQLNLKERLSSAVELLSEKDRKEMAELQLEDAADYAHSLDQKAVCPRLLPMTARILPVVLTGLIILMYVPSPYGQAQVPAEVRQAIKQAGVEMETAAGKIDKNALSDKAAELASKMENMGRELQDKPLTKKEALKNLSKLAHETEALKMMSEIAEKLSGDITPEKERALNELLKKLADNLKDIPEMAEFSQEITKSRQSNSLKQLADALERMGIKPSDMDALQKMLEQLAKKRRDVGQSMVRSPKDAGGNETSNLKADEESGLMGSGAPGKKTAKEMKEEIKSASHRPVSSDQGYDSELEGQVSETGRSVPDGENPVPKAGEASVPYKDIYVEYRDAADDAVNRTAIPWIYKERVKSYFDAVKPREF